MEKPPFDLSERGEKAMLEWLNFQLDSGRFETFDAEEEAYREQHMPDDYPLPSTVNSDAARLGRLRAGNGTAEDQKWVVAEIESLRTKPKRPAKKKPPSDFWEAAAEIGRKPRSRGRPRKEEESPLLGPASDDVERILHLWKSEYGRKRRGLFEDAIAFAARRWVDMFAREGDNRKALVGDLRVEIGDNLKREYGRRKTWNE